jgi:ABC-type multidrug transport system ATPase subunit
MTVEEHLFFNGRIKQVRNKPEEVERLINVLNLIVERNKLASTLSGGNKRKLSVAIALMEVHQLNCLMSHLQAWTHKPEGSCGV